MLLASLQSLPQAEMKYVDSAVLTSMSEELGADVCQQLLSLFVTELIDLSAQLALALAEKNLTAIGDITHILKNSAALYGANALAVSARELNDNLQQAPAQIIQAANLVQDLVGATLTAYQQLIDSAAATESGVLK